MHDPVTCLTLVIFTGEGLGLYDDAPDIEVSTQPGDPLALLRLVTLSARGSYHCAINTVAASTNTGYMDVSPNAQEGPDGVAEYAYMEFDHTDVEEET